MARAICGNVLERYFPRDAFTNSVALLYTNSAIKGGNPRNQYNVFFVYFTPNQLGQAYVVGRGSCANFIGMGFSTAKYGALACRHL